MHHMNEINQQAKDDVRKLLDELVVSPVSTDIERVVEKLDNLLSNFSTENENKINSLKRSIGVILPRLRESLDVLNGNIQSCEEDCKIIKRKAENANEEISVINKDIQKLQALKEDINKIDGNIQRTYDYLNKIISGRIKSIEKNLVHFEIIKKNTEISVHSIQKIEKELPLKIEELSKQYSEFRASIKDLSGSLTNNVNVNFLKLSTKLGEIKELVNAYSNQSDSIKDQLEFLSSKIGGGNKTSIIDVLNSLNTNVQKLDNEKFQNLSTGLDEIKELLHSYSNQSVCIKDQLVVLTNKIDDGNKEIKSSIDNMEVSLSTPILRNFKKNKVLLRVLIILSIINSFGIISIFINLLIN